MATSGSHQPERTGLRDGNQWYRMANASSGGRAVLDIYGDIGVFGVESAVLVGELRDLDVDELEVHINSAGGDVFEGLAIYNALLELTSRGVRINVKVDALAASIASVIAQAGDHITMAANAKMMIHDAMGMCMGNAADMVFMAELLNHMSDTIADVYSARAGGTPKSWRQAMTAGVDGTRYSATEAVAAGLADEVVKVGRRGEDPEARWSRSAVAHYLAGTHGRIAAWVDEHGLTADDLRARYGHVRSGGGGPMPAWAMAAPVHHSDTTEGDWDASAHTGRLDSPLSVATARAVHGWYDSTEAGDDGLPKSACKLPHHEVGEDGEPGPANLAGVRAALQRLPQSDIPEADQEAVRRHLVAHLDDAEDTEDAYDDGDVDDVVDVDAISAALDLALDGDFAARSMLAAAADAFEPDAELFAAALTLAGRESIDLAPSAMATVLAETAAPAGDEVAAALDLADRDEARLAFPADRPQEPAEPDWETTTRALLEALSS